MSHYGDQHFKESAIEAEQEKDPKQYTLEAALDADLASLQASEGITPDRALLTILDAYKIANMIREAYYLLLWNGAEPVLINSLEEAKKVGRKAFKRGLHGGISQAIQVKPDRFGWMTRQSRVVWTF